MFTEQNEDNPAPQQVNPRQENFSTLNICVYLLPPSVFDGQEQHKLHEPVYLLMWKESIHLFLKIIIFFK